MATVSTAWQDEPAWLRKKRQLAQILRERFPKFEHQEKWLPWQTMVTDQTNWLRVDQEYQALPLSEAVHRYSELLQENLMEKALRWQDNQLFAAHLTQIDGGQFIYIPDNTTINKPIEFAPQGMMTNPHNLIIVGANSTVSINEKMQVKSAQPLFAGTEILIGAGATVAYHWANELRAPAIFSAVHAYQARGAHLTTDLAVVNVGDVTISLSNFLDGVASTWSAAVLLRPGKTGVHSLLANVDGFGQGSHADLVTYADKSAGGQVTVGDFQPGSGEPLPVKSINLEKTSQVLTADGQPLANGWHGFDSWLNDQL